MIDPYSELCRKMDAFDLTYSYLELYRNNPPDSCQNCHFRIRLVLEMYEEMGWPFDRVMCRLRGTVNPDDGRCDNIFFLKRLIENL